MLHTELVVGRIRWLMHNADVNSFRVLSLVIKLLKPLTVIFPTVVYARVSVGSPRTPKWVDSFLGLLKLMVVLLDAVRSWTPLDCWYLRYKEPMYSTRTRNQRPRGTEDRWSDVIAARIGRSRGRWLPVNPGVARSSTVYWHIHGQLPMMRRPLSAAAAALVSRPFHVWRREVSECWFYGGGIAVRSAVQQFLPTIRLGHHSRCFWKTVCIRARFVIISYQRATRPITWPVPVRWMSTTKPSDQSSAPAHNRNIFDCFVVCRGRLSVRLRHVVTTDTRSSYIVSCSN